MRARVLMAVLAVIVLVSGLLAAPAAGATKHRPVITSISVHSAATTGGQRVVVHGRNMATHLRVSVLGRVVGYRRLSNYAISVRVPPRTAPGRGWLRIHTSSGGTSDTSRVSAFTYHWPAPQLTTSNPRVVSTNLPMVTISGRYLYDVRSVTEGGVHPYYFSESSDGRSLTFPSISSNPGHVSLRVVTAEGAASMTLTIASPPSVRVLSPADGPTAGGVTVTIEGNALDHPTRVTFGGVPATRVVGVDSHTVTAVIPAHAAGLAQVIVTNAVDHSAPLLYDAFRYGPVRPQSFGAPTTIDTAHVIDQLACPDPAFCMAIDSNDRYLTSDGQSWSPVSPDDATGAAGVQALSCTSPTFCLSAIDQYVWRWDGHSWTRIASPLDDRNVDIRALQCASPTLCVAISQLKAWVYDGTSFSAAALPFGFSWVLGGVSCWDEGRCEIAATNGWLATFAGGAWIGDGSLLDTSPYTVTSLYCASHTDCLAGTSRGSVVSARAETFHVLPLAVSHLLCTSTSSCLAVGGNTAATSAGSIWSTVQYFPGIGITAVTRTADNSALVASMHDVRTMTW